MYILLSIIGIAYALRFVVRFYAFHNIQLRIFAAFMLGMLGLLLFIGDIAGYDRWQHLKQTGTVTEGRVLFKGECPSLPYADGPHHRVFKHIERVSGPFNEGYNPFHEAPQGYSECIGYGFSIRSGGHSETIYATEVISPADFASLKLYDKVKVIYNPAYVSDNWLLDYRMSDNLKFGIIFLSMICEAYFSVLALNRCQKEK